MRDRHEETKRQAAGRQQRAMKLLEALSGVDQDLLERAEKKAAASPGRRIPAGSPWRNWSWAALLCLALVGAMGWGGYQMTRQVNEEGAGFAGDSGGNVEAIEVPSGEEGAIEQWAEGGTDQEEAGAGEGGTVEDKAETGAVNGEEVEAGDLQDKSSAEGAVKEEMDMSSSQKADRIKYTEEQAREQEKLGGYLPVELPEGYVFESAWSESDSVEANLTAVWVRGMDSIMWSVRIAEEAPETVALKLPETYDLNLYEIPYSESVPDRYRESVENPVFAREDFSLEAVEARMTVREDTGDTETPGGNFSVLYPDNVVVSFNGRGTAEEIWEMFCSLESAE